MLFDNKTKDESKRCGQVQQLLSLVNKIISQNCGRPYTDELFTELKVKVLQMGAMLILKFRQIMLYMSLNSLLDYRREQ